jgi:hypothetical protein
VCSLADVTTGLVARRIVAHPPAKLRTSLCCPPRSDPDGGDVGPLDEVHSTGQFPLVEPKTYDERAAGGVELVWPTPDPPTPHPGRRGRSGGYSVVETRSLDAALRRRDRRVHSYADLSPLDFRPDRLLKMRRAACLAFFILFERFLRWRGRP